MDGNRIIIGLKLKGRKRYIVVAHEGKYLRKTSTKRCVTFASFQGQQLLDLPIFILHLVEDKQVF